MNYAKCNKKLNKAISNLNTGEIFRAPTSSLWDAYLNACSPEERQRFNCNTCKSFIERWGGLVTIVEKDGVLKIKSLVWRGKDPKHVALRKIVEEDKTPKILTKSYVDKYGNTVVKHHPVWKHYEINIENLHRAASPHILPFNVILEEIDGLSYDSIVNASEYLKEKRPKSASGLDVVKDVKSMLIKKVSRQQIHLYILKYFQCTPNSVMTIVDAFNKGRSMSYIDELYINIFGYTYQNTSAAVSADQAKAAANLLEELGYTTSDFNRRLLEKGEFPVIWESSIANADDLTLHNAFLKLAKDANCGGIDGGSIKIGLSDFINDIVPDAELIEVSTDAILAYMTTSATDSSKPFLKWDTPEKPFPYLATFYAVKSGSDVMPVTLKNCRANMDAYLPVESITAFLPPGDRNVKFWRLLFEINPNTFNQVCVDVGTGLFKNALKDELRPSARLIQKYSESDRFTNSTPAIYASTYSSVNEDFVRVTTDGIVTKFSIVIDHNDILALNELELVDASSASPLTVS